MNLQQLAWRTSVQTDRSESFLEHWDPYLLADVLHEACSWASFDTKGGYLTEWNTDLKTPGVRMVAAVCRHALYHHPSVPSTAWCRLRIQANL